MSEPVVRLHSSGLLSKWGFGDGDAPDVWLDWCDEQGIGYGDWRSRILPGLVRRYLLPALDQRVDAVQISCNHNPIRAAAVDGVDVSDRWYDSRDGGSVLTPEYVEVTMEQVLEIAREAPDPDLTERRRQWRSSLRGGSGGDG